MSLPMQPSLPYDGFRAHYNRGLFADHYLNNPERLQALDEWKQATGVDEALKQIFQRYAQQATYFTNHTNEAQTENDFIKPVLNLLWGEDYYQVQVSIPNVDVRRQPDYAFFRAAEDRQAAQPRHGTLDYWRNVPCLGDAKKWTASLDKERGVDENPSAQICNYLYRARVRWGILTNGRIWRLYEREKSSAGGIYYEVCLEDLIQRGDLDAFKYFYLFFRRKAFVPDRSGVSFVEKVFQGSVEYATDVGGRLKESVYDALRLLMDGFFEYSGNGLDRYDPDTVKSVHDNCLIVLYRLLFLLYAEDRGLLPRNTEPYATYSLYSLQREINEHLRARNTYPPVGHRFWSHLTNLFELIDEGFPKGGIPAYNGGLFSPSKYPHIAHTRQQGMARWEIGDHRLAQVIDMLAYQREQWNKPGTQDIDYNTLDVQHLGSIYEGLLELQPHFADELMVETVENGKSVFKPAPEMTDPRAIHGQPPRKVKQGEVYLITNRGERKATGSYYTPKYIVDYIVENTLVPLTEEAAKKVAEFRPEVDKEIKKLEREKRAWEKLAKRQSEAATESEASPADSLIAHSPAEHVKQFNSLIDQQKRRLLEPYLSLRILDPAMGSGHFLVGAADFLSLAMATDPNLPPLEEMDDEDPQTFYKRLVVERCLYGVDLNPLAVELAKLSLWLHTVSRDKALSFLDHHLRCGNSLIGARIEDDLATTPPELDSHGRIKKRDTRQLLLGFTETLTAKHLHYFLDTFRKIVEAPTGDAKIERMKDKWYRAMDAVRDKFRAAANCWIAPYFGVPVTPEQYQHAVATLRGTETDWQALTEEAWFQQAQSVAHDKRFFHWELEFPEIFFHARGFKPEEERGFDAVIGNPPYGLFEEEQEKVFIGVSLPEIPYQFDKFPAFMLKGFSLYHTDGAFSFIVPNTWLVNVEFKDFTRRVLDNHLFRIGNYTFKVFPEATVDTLVFFCQRREADQLEIEVYHKEGIVKSISIDKNLLIQLLDSGVSLLANLEESPLFTKCLRESTPLRDVAQVTQGTKPFQVGKGNPPQTRDVVDSQRFVAEYKIDDSFVPLLRGSFIDRYEIKWDNDYWISYGEWLAEPRFSANFFADAKLVLRQTGDRPIAAYDDKRFVVRDNLYVVHLRRDEVSLYFILALLNSSLFDYLFQFINPERGEALAQLKIGHLQNLPIRRIDFTTPASERAKLLEKGKRLYEQCIAKGDNDCVSGFVEHQLSQTPERADVVHDLLAFLAEEMIEMNKQKQVEVKGFLTWLERTIGAKVDDLKNKTKLRAYHQYSLQVLLTVLRQNLRSLTVNPNARTVQEAIEREFNQSISKLTPLKEKLAATDRLIDLIVYRLYGLTEEETAIVENSISQT